MLTGPWKASPWKRGRLSIGTIKKKGAPQYQGTPFKIYNDEEFTEGSLHQWHGSRR